MKRLIFLSAGIGLSLMAFAQNYETIRNEALLGQYQKAKDDLDKAWANAKFISKPEAYILKVFVYAGLALDPKLKGTGQPEKLLAEADAAYKKYQEMDPSLALVNDQIYQNGPVNLYSGYYTTGYEYYTAKNWEPGYRCFQKAVEYSELLIEKKLLTATVDTNVLILAGLTAENSNHKEDAVKAYSHLADHRITGEGFESIYRYLVSYYFGKKDIPSFEKYKAIGAELFPKSEFFSYDKIDFALGFEANFYAKLKALEELLATDPNSFKGNEVLGEIIFDTLNPREDNIPPPPDAEDLEKKMMAAFHKAIAANPGFENTFIYMGDHFINKAVKVDGERTAFLKEMKKRTKPGSLPSKEDAAQRDALDKKYGDFLEMARDPYEKAAAIFAKKDKEKLTLQDKQQYKKAVSYLSDIFAFKKVMAKSKPADAAAFAAEEKKWNEIWESIK